MYISINICIHIYVFVYKEYIYIYNYIYIKIFTHVGESFLRKIEGVVAGSDTGQSPLLLGNICILKCWRYSCIYAYISLSIYTCMYIYIYIYMYICYHTYKHV
jgi:hypothetical protein